MLEKRTVVQALTTFLSNSYLQGFTQGKIFTGPSKQLCLPGLNCYSCPGALGACPLGSLQAVLGQRNFSFSFYLVGFFLLVGSLCGRFICGWLCPFGWVQDLLHKIPFVPKLRQLPGERYWRLLRYLLLLVFVLLLPLLVVDIIGQGSPWFCTYICPAGTLMAGIPLVVANEGIRSAVGWLFVWKSFILVGILVLAVIIYRPFCRYLCPLGAIYGWFNPLAIYRYRIDPAKCTHCGACQVACPLAIATYRSPNSSDCVRCGKCKAACPTQAIS
ncbi:MAG: 4Fe-4S binding protein [Acidaminococcaceae bacterium]